MYYETKKKNNWSIRIILFSIIFAIVAIVVANLYALLYTPPIFISFK